MKAVITGNHIKIDGVKYFIGGASHVGFASYGTKDATLPGGEASRLDVFDYLPAPKVEKVELSITSLSVEFEGSSGIGLFANVKLPDSKGNIKVGIGPKEFTSGEAVLLRVSPKDQMELIRQINAAPKMKDKLIDFDGKARIAFDLLVVASGVLYTEFRSGIGASASIVVGGAVVHANAGAGSVAKTKLELSPNTVIGYTPAEPKWNATRDKNKTTVTELRMDAAA